VTQETVRRTAREIFHGVEKNAQWLALATAGNILGGVIIVTVLNFGQVHAGQDI